MYCCPVLLACELEGRLRYHVHNYLFRAEQIRVYTTALTFLLHHFYISLLAVRVFIYS